MKALFMETIGIVIEIIAFLFVAFLFMLFFGLAIAIWNFFGEVWNGITKNPNK